MTDLTKFDDLTPAGIDQGCEAIEAWAAETVSTAELQEALDRIAGRRRYLARRTKEGRGRMALTMGRLDLRMGELLGPAQNGGDRKSDRFRSAKTDLPGDMTPSERSELRKMAAHRDEVERELVKSTDEEPTSRRKVMAAIRDTQERDPQEGPSAAVELARLARQLSEGLAKTSPQEVADVLGDDQGQWDIARAEWDGVIGWLNSLFKLRPKEVPVEKLGEVRVVEVEHRPVGAVWQWRARTSSQVHTAPTKLLVRSGALAEARLVWGPQAQVKLVPWTI